MNTIASLLKKTLAPLAASLALMGSPSQAAITLTPLQSPVMVAPGAHALVDFKVDFGSDPLELISFDLGLAYDATKLSLDAAPTFSYAGTAPDFSAGTFVGTNLPGVFVITWALGAPPFPDPFVLPTFAGEGVLRFSFTNAGLSSGSTALILGLAYSTLDEDLEAGTVATVIASAVPEPQAWLLCLAGLAVVAVPLRRRNARG
ncbi:hypothetical protein [Roseateles toxinivorans]|uniref:Secreted protein with PEP-CTERM sorting signal n=1 Tax=Roseateles toxinivorans TaxID=270368 RepID=A0A4R6QTJ3_9BURK|nr:hypothetical protein [Roseateles toxinivorans]TDP74707.1 hypothetical protein DES47_101773 [Roseateles toxinivorans]